MDRKSLKGLCLDCREDRGRTFPASHIAPFCIPRGESYWDGTRMLWNWETARGDLRPVCDEHKELNDSFWLAFTGRTEDDGD